MKLVIMRDRAGWTATLESRRRHLIDDIPLIPVWGVTLMRYRPIQRLAFSWWYKDTGFGEIALWPIRTPLRGRPSAGTNAKE